MGFLMYPAIFYPVIRTGIVSQSYAERLGSLRSKLKQKLSQYVSLAAQSNSEKYVSNINCH